MEWGEAWEISYSGGIHRFVLKADEYCFPRKTYINTKFYFQFQEVGDHLNPIHGLLDSQIRHAYTLEYRGGAVLSSVNSMVGKVFL